jgi:UDP-glucose 4-epimerase
MELNKDIEELFKKMMRESKERSQDDEIYQEDMKDVGRLRVQWEICGICGYQIYDSNMISYKFGERLVDPDVTLVILDKELGIRFLKGEQFPFDYGIHSKGNLIINHTEGWEIVDTEKGKKRVRIKRPFVTTRFNKEKHFHPYIISKLPIFRNFVRQRMTDEDYGVYIPINKSLGKFANVVIPYTVFKHFIEKASHIVMMKDCPCRMFNDCQDHDKSIGCMYMGDDTVNLLLPQDRGGVVTKEEALERVKCAIDDGLIPLLGRAMDEAEGFGIPDTGHFLSMCFCCPCCCVNGRIVRYASKGLNIFYRMEGLTVTVDKELCVGCEACLEVCVFKGMEMVDGLAQVNQEYCLGCGRCEGICPNEAISISLDDPHCVDELITTIEAHVEVN